jgi:hypothetical protein
MGFTAVDVREDSLLFRLRGRYIRVEGRGRRSHESRDWRGLRRAREVTDERGYGSAYGVGYGCAIA